MADNLKWSVILFCFILSLSNSSRSQGLPYIKKEYSYESINRLGQPDLFKLYFIIGDTIRKFNNKFYKDLIFSFDSASVTGYIRYDSLLNQIFFVDPYFHPNKTNNTGYQAEEPYISFFNDTINSEIEEGQIITVVKDNGNEFDIKSSKIGNGSDGRRIREFIFMRGQFSPRWVIVNDPLLNKEIYMEAK